MSTIDAVVVQLAEQAEQDVWLTQRDADFLAGINFAVTPISDVEDGHRFFKVNPQQWVGHFRMPSGTVTTIIPKIQTASVLRMLAYSFLRWKEQMLRPELVKCETDSFLFEPLVRLFNDLVAARARRGLVQDYVRHEENLALVRGKILFKEHIEQNIGYPNRAYCRFFENTVDISDNQIIRRTLRVLLANGGWTKGTEHSLIANLHQFEAVSDVDSRGLHFGAHHYHHLNEDYEPIHRLCALFLSTSSVSEVIGGFAFSGFLLDMNKLFEKFVEQAFVRVGARMGLEILPQKEDRLSDRHYIAFIRPDIIVAHRGKVRAVVDAKYKRDAYGPQNSDLFQVVAYGTALSCNDTYLLYPETELAVNRELHVRNSPIIVKTRRVAISGAEAVNSAEECVKAVLDSALVSVTADSSVLSMRTERSSQGENRPYA